MGKLAVGPVDVAPLVKQRHDLRRPRPASSPCSGLPPGARSANRPRSRRRQPAPHPTLVELQTSSRTDAPASRRDRLIDQVEQPVLGGRVDPAGDAATQPQPSFPSTRVKLDRQLLDRLGQPGDLGVGLLEFVVALLAPCVPGRDADSAASAPSLATGRIRMIVDRSTCHATAASFWVTSCPAPTATRSRTSATASGTAWRVVQPCRHHGSCRS